HPTRIVGEFYRGEPVDFTGRPNIMDAALGRVRPGSAVPFLCQIGPVTGVAEKEEEDIVVYAFGKSSLFTKGVVIETEAKHIIQYPGKRRALFVNQLVIRSLLPQGSFSLRGDSGALIVNKNR